MSLEVEIIAPHQLFEFGCGHTSEAMCCKCAEAGTGDNKSLADVARLIALELAVNELADRVAALETFSSDVTIGNDVLRKRIDESEQENIALNKRLAVLELRPQTYPLPQPYPVHPGWIPQPGVIPGTPWYSPPDSKFMGMYYTTKEST